MLPHLEQEYVRMPLSVQVAGFVTTPAPYRCPVAGIVSVRVSPHSVQVYVRTPEEVQPAGLVTAPLFQTCSCPGSGPGSGSVPASVYGYVLQRGWDIPQFLDGVPLRLAPAVVDVFYGRALKCRYPYLFYTVWN